MLELIIKKISASKVRHKRSNIIRCKKNYCKFSVNSLAIMTTQQIGINYIEKNSMKSDDKNTKYYQISK